MTPPTRIVAIALSIFLFASPALAQERIAAPLEQLLKQFKPTPEAEAEIILRSTQITLGADYLSQTRSYVAAYINSESAVRDYSQISISFNSYYEDITLEFAQVRTPDGRIHPVRADATQIQSPTEENFYHDRKELLFSLPNVRVGSVIEFQYQRRDSHTIIPGQWFDGAWFHWWEGRAAGLGVRADPVALSEIRLQAPADIQIQTSDTERYGATLRRRVSNGVQTLHWSRSQLPELVLQDGMPRERHHTPSVRMSTLENWQQVARWADQLIAPHIAGDADIERLVSDIRREHSTSEDRVKAVYSALKDQVRYVFAHVGRGGYEPHSAHNVLANGYGDCKDQSVLAVTLLRKLDIEAYPALISTRSRGLPETDIPNVNFDHMIVYIPAQAGVEETWLDTTGENSLYPGNAASLEGQPALVVKPDSQQITLLPNLPSGHHYAFFELLFDPVEGKDLSAAFHLRLGGMFEENLRSLWHYAPERDKTFRETINNLYPGAEIVSLQGNHADDLWQPFSISGSFAFIDAWPGEQQPLTYGFNLGQMLSTFSGLFQLHLPADRLQDYVIDPGYTLRTRIKFKSPSAGHRAEATMSGIDIDNRYFSLKQQGLAEGEDYVVTQEFQLHNNHIALNRYDDFHRQVRNLLNSPHWLVSYNYNKAEAKLQALKEAHTEENAAKHIAVARHHLQQGAFEHALESANRAVQLEPKNGEAHYVLGLSQGYRNQLTESDHSFAKAEELGYHP